MVTEMENALTETTGRHNMVEESIHGLVNRNHPNCKTQRKEKEEPEEMREKEKEEESGGQCEGL